MLRLLLTRRWLAWLAGALVASTACFFLGLWQWHKWETKHVLQSQISDNYEASPRPLGDVLPRRESAVRDEDGWAQVRVTGRYLVDHQLLVRNRPLSGTYGYEVLVPLRTSSGEVVVVDRGWVQNGPNADTPPPVPAAPSGEVTVTGWLRPGERDLSRPPVPGQLSSIHLPTVASVTGQPVREGGFLRLRDEQVASGATPQRPAALERPEPGSSAGVNLSYAIQWWLALVAFPGLVLFMARREAQDADPDVVPRPKKVRIWDEEDA